MHQDIGKKLEPKQLEGVSVGSDFESYALIEWLVNRLSALAQSKSENEVLVCSVGNEYPIENRKEWLEELEALQVQVDETTGQSPLHDQGKPTVLSRLKDSIDKWRRSLVVCDTNANINFVRRAAGELAAELSRELTYLDGSLTINEKANHNPSVPLTLDETQCVCLLRSAARKLDHLPNSDLEELARAIFPNVSPLLSSHDQGTEFHAKCDDLMRQLKLPPTLAIGFILRKVGLGWSEINELRLHLCGAKGHRDGNDVKTATKTYGLEMVRGGLDASVKQGVKDWLKRRHQGTNNKRQGSC